MTKAMKTITDKKGGSMGTGYSGVSGLASSQGGSSGGGSSVRTSARLSTHFSVVYKDYQDGPRCITQDGAGRSGMSR